MKFLCLAYENEEIFHRMTTSDWSALRTETLVYAETIRQSGHLLATHALRSARTSSILRVREGKLSTTDGPFAETKEQIGGYFLVEARDQAEAIEIASRWPSARLGSIEVRPIEEQLPADTRYL